MRSVNMLTLLCAFGLPLFAQTQADHGCIVDGKVGYWGHPVPGRAATPGAAGGPCDLGTGRPPGASQSLATAGGAAARGDSEGIPARGDEAGHCAGANRSTRRVLTADGGRSHDDPHDSARTWDRLRSPGRGSRVAPIRRPDGRRPIPTPTHPDPRIRHFERAAWQRLK
jgi:hypothetical protein